MQMLLKNANNAEYEVKYYEEKDFICLFYGIIGIEVILLRKLRKVPE